MMHLTTAAVTLIAAMVAYSAEAAPKFSSGTSAKGVIAYQDYSDPTQFHYFPARVDVALGETLLDFQANYWGIGPAMMGQISDGSQVSVVGAVLSGRAVLDITQAQRDAIAQQIKKDFHVPSPKLLPLHLDNWKVTPTIAAITMGLDKGEVILPQGVQFASPFTYTLGTGDSRFAQIVGMPNSSSGVTTNPHFGVNIVADVEWVGDKWEGTISCDLKQVWSDVRKSAGASVGWGWFSLGVSYSDIEKNLDKSGACKFDFVEGSLANEKYGRQIFEMMKELFTAINTKATAGEGFFKFEPNPDAAETGGNPGGAGPWALSINLGYSEAHFKQSIQWSTHISYTGRQVKPIAASMVLAVTCSPSTARYFVDHGNLAEPCITQQKIDVFNARLKSESACKKQLIADLVKQYLANPSMPAEKFDKIKAYYEKEYVCGDSRVAVKPRARIPLLLGPPADDDVTGFIQEQVQRLKTP
jgi:hypothetical protein